MLTYDLQRYRPAFSISVVDQILEDIRRGLEQNVYSANQKRIATIKFLGELYNYRMFSSSIIFDTLWLIVTFGHRESPCHSEVCHTLSLGSQRMDDRYLVNQLHWTCRMISFASDLYARFWILVECASIVERRRRNWITS